MLPDNAPLTLIPHVTALLKQAGINTEIETLQTAKQGGNNRIYRIETPAGNFALKQYFRSPHDQRDRLLSEYQFLEYANQVAAHQVPQALACDHQAGFALYSFISGRHLSSSELNISHIDQAADFFCALNPPHIHKHKLPIKKASEACFSIAEHLDLVDNRILNLKNSLYLQATEPAAYSFVEELHAYYSELHSQITITAQKQNQYDQPLDTIDYCVSPSDFGFHNALLQSDGTLKFIDFEYAGLDDPAKMTGDFFAQLAIPIPGQFFKHFSQRCLQVFTNPEKMLQRSYLLRPVYKIKWCCIAMNVFLPEHMARRKFANAQLDEQALKTQQLLKAKTIFNTLKQENNHGLY